MRNLGFFFFLFVYALGASLTLVSVDGKPARESSTNDATGPWKRHDESSTGYLEQCGVVAFPDAQPGSVNVLAFLDSSWPYSHRQAIMLRMLNERLQKSGLPDTIFFVVNVDPSSSRTEDNTEDDVEREAWLGVSPEEIESFADIVKTADSLASSMTPEIRLIQDNEDLRIWNELRASRDQVLVIDRCGKLTYQVIVPWSILHFPYVKAAILSTYRDEPCGPCDVIDEARDPLENRDETTTQTSTEDSDVDFVRTTEGYFQNDRDADLPVATESDAMESTSFANSDFTESTNFINFDATESTNFINFDATESTNFMNFDSTESTILPNSDSTESTILPNSDTTELPNFMNSALIATESTNKMNSDATESPNFVNSDATKSIETEEATSSSVLPIRIIMHAPHFHVDDDSTRMHEYLVLKTGSSDYHRHLTSYDATRSYRGPQDFREEPEHMRNPEVEDRTWSSMGVVYNRDESPGLYGEVADYWKNSGGQDDYKEPNTEDEISKKPHSKTGEQSPDENGIVKTDYSTAPDDKPEKSEDIAERLQADFADENSPEKPASNDETFDVEEEERRSELIAHYSKLLPWIYYVLD